MSRTSAWAFAVLAASVIVVAWAVVPTPRSGSSGAEPAVVSSAAGRAEDAAVASRAVDRFERFRSGRAGVQLALDGDELSAVLRHTLPGLLPEGVADPAVRLAEGRVELSARVATDAYPGAQSLGALIAVLPDTVGVTLRGTLGRDGGDLVFVVSEAWADHLPVPGPLVEALLVGAPLRSSPYEGRSGDDLADAHLDRATGSTSGPGLRAPWPRGVRSLDVRGRWLVLEADEPIADRAVDGSGSDDTP